MTPISYRRDRVSALRGLPIRSNPQLTLLDYRATPPLPTGGRPRTVGHGAVRLSGFVVSVCIVREGGASYLETALRAYDEARQRREPMAWTEQARADILRLAEQRHLALQGRESGGRN